MLRLVTIDLRAADLPRFEAYEAKVLALLPKYGAALERRVRTLDGAMETHLLRFPDAGAYERYLADPVRVNAQEEWLHCGARSMSAAVDEVGSR